LTKELKVKVIELLNSQKRIFGDNLFFPFEYDILRIRSENIEKKNTTNEKIISKKMNGNLSFFAEPFEKANSIEELFNLINTCRKCSLGNTRNKFVFGSGNPNADVMVIGEAPGADEDAQGLPFVGRAGKLLTDILNAINLDRENEVYIANILKCRPPNNRNPLPNEEETCIPYLYKQIELIRPKAILLLGLVAAQILLKQKISLTKLRGNVYTLNGIDTMVTYHPAALLRNPNWKRPCWEDLKKFKKMIDLSK
jgi:DNA polymerase